MDVLFDTDRPANKLSTTSFLGAALPPVPHKLVEKIKSGALVEMGEILPSHLILTDDELEQKPKHYKVSSLTEWL